MIESGHDIIWGTLVIAIMKWNGSLIATANTSLFVYLAVSRRVAMASAWKYQIHWPLVYKHCKYWLCLHLTLIAHHSAPFHTCPRSAWLGVRRVRSTARVFLQLMMPALISTLCSVQIAPGPFCLYFGAIWLDKSNETRVYKYGSFYLGPTAIGQILSSLA